MGAFVLFAGCSSGQTAIEEDPSDDRVRPPAEARFGSDEGAIEGVVVDSALSPIEGANVTLEPGSGGDVLAFWITGSDGRFAFSNLEPAAYRLRASAAMFGNGTALAQTVAGESTMVTVRVDPLASVEAYIQYISKRGILRCGFSAVVWADTCTAETVMGKNLNMMDFNVTEGHRWVVVETEWARTGVTMDHDFFVRDPGKAPRGTIVGRGFGKPVLRADFWPGKEYQATPVAAKNVFPASENAFVFRIETWYDGQFQKEANDLGGAACSYMLLGYCTGVGLDVELTFTEHVSIFMNGVPENVARYSALPDR